MLYILCEEIKIYGSVSNQHKRMVNIYLSTIFFKINIQETKEKILKQVQRQPTKFYLYSECFYCIARYCYTIWQEFHFTYFLLLLTYCKCLKCTLKFCEKCFLFFLIIFQSLVLALFYENYFFAKKVFTQVLQKIRILKISSVIFLQIFLSIKGRVMH